MAVSIRDAMLVYRTRSGNGSVLAFREAVFWRSAFATRCWFTALSVIMGQCWLSLRLFFGGQHSRRDVGPRTDAIGLPADLKVLKRSILSFFGYRGVFQARQAPGGCSSRVPGTCQQKPLGLGLLFYNTSVGGPRQGRHSWWQSPSFTWAP